MAKQSIATLKNWFKKGLKPLEAQFSDWLDSFWHKDATDIPITSVDNLQNILNNLASSDSVIALRNEVLDGVPVAGNSLNKLYELITSLGRSRGGYDASTGVVPGSVANQEGDFWRVTVAGTIPGLFSGAVDLQPGDLLLALEDGAINANQFYSIQSNVGQATSSVLGLVKLYTDLLTANNDGTVTQAAILNALNQKAALNYQGASPSTVTVGGVPANTVLTGRSLVSLVEQILVQYLAPAFSSFSINGQSTIIEVGSALSGFKNFVWSITNPTNVKPDTVAIRDVNANILIAFGRTNDGAESVDIGNVLNNAPGVQSYRGEAENTNNQALQSANFSISKIYPYFHGKVSSNGGTPGANRPIISQIMINAGVKVVADSTGTISINFNSTADDYFWFAIPATSADKTKWFIDDLNNGTIGGAISPGGNLFPDEVLMNINSPSGLWSNVQYRIYLTNYQSMSNLIMQLRNV
jgi:hypothetical protein